MNARQVKDALSGFVDKVTARRGGTFEAKVGYFYTNGMTAEKVAASIERVIPGVVILKKENSWNAWPKESYFKVTFQMPIDGAVQYGPSFTEGGASVLAVELNKGGSVS